MPRLTPEPLEPEATQAVATAIIDALEAVSHKLATRILALQEDQAAVREEIYALTQRMDAVERTARARRRA